MMRALALALLTITLGQPSGSSGGDWTGDFRGTTYIRLSLSDKGGTPQGALGLCKTIHVDGQGNVDSVTDAPLTLTPLTDVRRNGNVWSFSYDDGDDVTKFELRFIDQSTAELTVFLSDEVRQQLAADGVPPPKPFRLAKSR